MSHTFSTSIESGPRRGAATFGRLAAALLPALLLATPEPARAQAPRGVVYIESDIGHVEGQNSILAFRRDNATGLLTPLGEFPTRGTGVHPTDTLTRADLGPFDSDQDLIANPGGTRLFAVNSGSDTIAVLDIKADGSLAHVPGSPFPSGASCR